MRTYQRKVSGSRKVEDGATDAIIADAVETLRAMRLDLNDAVVDAESESNNSSDSGPDL